VTGDRNLVVEDALVDYPAPELYFTDIYPNDLGKDLQNPAPIGSKVISEDWEITVLETERGARALEIAQEANQNTREPDSGMEYIVFKARLRYIGNSATARTIYGDNFQSIGSNGEFYKAMGYGSTKER
jgi:hypothetical protein